MLSDWMIGLQYLLGYVFEIVLVRETSLTLASFRY
jgi:hypothetical protein